MNLRNNKGFAVEDISIAVIIIMIFIPTVFGAIYNIQKSDVEIKRKVEAIKIATDLLDKGYDNKNYYQNDGFESKDNKFEKIDTKSNVQYRITLDFDDENKLTVKVEYPIGMDTKSIEISKQV